jgi:hypothetical protein
MSLTYVTAFVTTGVNDWRKGYTCLKNPTGPLAAAHRVLMEKAEQGVGGAYLAVRLDLRHRPRSTGWKSQNHHIRGHARQLCEYTGYTMSEMMQAIKEDTPSWPVEFREFRGKQRKFYASEADISMEVCAEAIEICHRTAFDLGVVLIEENDKEAK